MHHLPQRMAVGAVNASYILSDTSAPITIGTFTTSPDHSSNRPPTRFERRPLSQTLTTACGSATYSKTSTTATITTLATHSQTRRAPSRSHRSHAADHFDRAFAI